MVKFIVANWYCFVVFHILKNYLKLSLVIGIDIESDKVEQLLICII